MAEIHHPPHVIAAIGADDVRRHCRRALGAEGKLLGGFGVVVAPFAGKVVHLGPVGAGHAMKAVNNILLAANILTLGEGLVTLAKFGIEPRAAVDVLNASSGRSFVSEVLVPQRVLTGTWPPLFRLALLEKDAGIAVDTAVAVGIDHPVLDFVREEFRALRQELGEGADYLDPIRRAEQLAGVELRG